MFGYDRKLEEDRALPPRRFACEPLLLAKEAENRTADDEYERPRKGKLQPERDHRPAEQSDDTEAHLSDPEARDIQRRVNALKADLEILGHTHDPSEPLTHQTRHWTNGIAERLDREHTGG